MCSKRLSKVETLSEAVTTVRFRSSVISSANAYTVLPEATIIESFGSSRRMAVWAIRRLASLFIRSLICILIFLLSV